MKASHFLRLALLCASAPCFAQSTQGETTAQAIERELMLERAQQARAPQEYPGAAKLGAILGGRSASSDAAFMRGVIQGQQARQQEEAQHAHDAEAARVAREAYWRGNLAQVWEAQGLSQSEAIAAANVYTYSLERQNALGERIHREGVKSGWTAAQKAFSEYNYQLANELMVATIAVFRYEEKQKAEQQPTPQPQPQPQH